MHLNPIKNIAKVSFAFAMALTAMAHTTEAQAQDLIARQAPIDRKMKTVDSLVINKAVQKQQAAQQQLEAVNFEQNELYTTWETKYVHCYGNQTPPDHYKIDLRGFAMPTPSKVVTSNYGYRASFGRMHKGIDVKVYIGDTIVSAFDGKVRIVNYEAKGYGNYVVVRHNNGLETIYGHLSKHLCKVGDIVRAGQPIGLGGNTGRSTGSHLHFETRILGEAINPALMFDFVHQDVTGDFYEYRRNGSSAASGKGSTASAPKAKKEAPAKPAATPAPAKQPAAPKPAETPAPAKQAKGKKTTAPAKQAAPAQPAEPQQAKANGKKKVTTTTAQASAQTASAKPKATAKTEQPQAKKQQPAAKDQGKATAQAAPAKSKAQTPAKSQQAAAKSQQPAAKTQQPAAKSQGKATAQAAPAKTQSAGGKTQQPAAKTQAQPAAKKQAQPAAKTQGKATAQAQPAKKSSAQAPAKSQQSSKAQAQPAQKAASQPAKKATSQPAKSQGKATAKATPKAKTSGQSKKA